MRYKTHIVTSLSLGAGLSIVFHYPFHILYVLGISFGSLLPDIDEPKSFIGRRSFGIAQVFKRNFGHRGLTHSLVAWVIISIFLLIYPTPLTLGISIGYLFHILGDLFSTSSVPIFAPIDNRRPKSPFVYKVGNRSENFILYIFTFVLVYFVFIGGELHYCLIESTAELVMNIFQLLTNYLDFE